MNDEGKGLVLVFFTVILWSTIEVASKLLEGQIPPMTLSFLRFTIGGIFLLPLALKGILQGDARDCTYRDWISLVLLSALGITLTFSLFHYSLIWISASSVATLISMVPVFVAPIGFFILGERLNRLQIIGLLMGSAGVILIYVSEESDPDSMVGVGIMVVAVISFSVYSVLMKRLNIRMTPMVSTPLTLLIGGALTIPLVLADGNALLVPLDLKGYLVLAWVGIFAVGLAYLFYFLGVHRTKLAKGNSLLYMKPFLAGVLAWLVLGESPSLPRVLAVLIISISIYFVLHERKIKSLRW